MHRVAKKKKSQGLKLLFHRITPVRSNLKSVVDLDATYTRKIPDFWGQILTPHIEYYRSIPVYAVARAMFCSCLCTTGVICTLSV
jgi:hypothetical protein